MITDFMKEAIEKYTTEEFKDKIESVFANYLQENLEFFDKDLLEDSKFQYYTYTDDDGNEKRVLEDFDQYGIISNYLSEEFGPSVDGEYSEIPGDPGYNEVLMSFEKCYQRYMYSKGIPFHEAFELVTYNYKVARDNDAWKKHCSYIFMEEVNDEPNVCLKIDDGRTLIWYPTQEDMFAEDWCVVFDY